MRRLFERALVIAAVAGAIALAHAQNSSVVPGGGASPGGSNTQCQYNNAGAFGGISGCTTNGTAVTLTAPVLGAATGTSLSLATGTAAAPSLTFGGTAGIYGAEGGVSVNSFSFGFSTPSFYVTQGEIGGVSNAHFCWRNQVNTFAGSGVDTCIKRNAAGTVEINNGSSTTYREVKVRSVVIGGTAPTATGNCAIDTQVGGNTAGTFQSNGGCATDTVILTFGFTAPNGWACFTTNRTDATRAMPQTASSTTTATFTGTMTDNDVVQFACTGY